MKSRYLLVLIVGLLLGALLGCARGGSASQGTTAPGGNGQASGRQLQVTASFYPLYYFASVIGGEHAAVYNVTPAGAEPHDFEPTSQDIARIENGNLLILNGGVEPWGDKIRGELAGTNVKVVVAGEGLLTQQVTDQGKSTLDPHVWLSPALARKEVEKILSGFMAADPTNSTFYQAQAATLETQLDQLDASFRAGMAHCQQKDFVTSHAAFGYLAAEYGLNQIAITGLSPDAEPSARDLANIATLARQKHIQYIFFESLVSPRLSETLADEVGARTLVLDPLEGLTAEQIRQGKTYFTVMHDNLVNLETALQCTT